MFTGEHERLLDDKGRLSMPRVFRRYLADPAYLARSGTDPCLLLYPEEEIQRAASRLKDKVRAGEVTANQHRRWAASISEVQMDSQGRLAIPPKLRESAGLSREVVLIGVMDRAEIWTPEAWADVQNSNEDSVNEGIWL